jgi:hypothetical protein
MLTPPKVKTTYWCNKGYILNGTLCFMDVLKPMSIEYRYFISDVLFDQYMDRKEMCNSTPIA